MTVCHQSLRCTRLFLLLFVLFGIITPTTGEKDDALTRVAADEDKTNIAKDDLDTQEDTNDAKDTKDTNTRDTQDAKDTMDTKDVTKDTLDARPTKDTKDATLDTKEPATKDDKKDDTKDDTKDDAKDGTTKDTMDTQIISKETTTTDNSKTSVQQLPAASGMNAAALTPPAFYDVTHANVALTLGEAAGSDLTKHTSDISSVIGQTVGVPAAAVHSTVVKTGQMTANAYLQITMSSSDRIKSDLCMDLTMMACLETIEVQNLIAEKLRKQTSSRRLESNASSTTTACSETTFCEITSIVAKVAKNAGIWSQYQYLFLVAVVLLVLVLLQLCATPLCVAEEQQEVEELSPGYPLLGEKSRGDVVMPIFAFAMLTYCITHTYMSYQKYQDLADACATCDASGVCEGNVQPSQCPATQHVMILEITFVPGLALILFCIFLCWWGRNRWPLDIKIEASVEPHIMPLESVMRRNGMMAPLVMPQVDPDVNPDAMQHKQYEVVLDLLLSYLVVLGSCMLLQEFQFPGLWGAWNPYKILWELLISQIVKFCFHRFVARKLVFNYLKYVVVLAILSVDIWFEVLVYQACVAASGFDWGFKENLRILDACIGAGLLNFLLGQFLLTLAAHFISVYFYEPCVRHDYKKCLYLTSPEQAKQVHNILEDEDDDTPHEIADEILSGQWQAVGKPIISGRSVTSVSPDLEKLADSEDEAETDEGGAQRQSIELRSVVATDINEDEWMELTSTGFSKSRPVCVQVQKRDQGTFCKDLIWFFDLVFRVESELPVRPWDYDESDLDEQMPPGYYKVGSKYVFLGMSQQEQEPEDVDGNGNGYIPLAQNGSVKDVSSLKSLPGEGEEKSSLVSSASKHSLS